MATIIVKYQILNPIGDATPIYMTKEIEYEGGTWYTAKVKVIKEIMKTVNERKDQFANISIDDGKMIHFYYMQFIHRDGQTYIKTAMSDFYNLPAKYQRN